MKTTIRRLATCGIAGAAVLLISALATAQALNIKPGLWEVTNSATIGGMPQIAMPQVDTSKMTPEQRARVEAAMSGMQGGPGKPTTTRECMTADRINQQMFQDKKLDPSCTQTTISRTSSSQELKIECTGEHAASGTLKFTASDSENVTGVVAMTMATGRGAGMTMNSKFTAKWIGADCGDVK